MKVGFIGLGIMGSRMAANLQKHGHDLVVFNRTREKAEPLLAQGARWAASPAAVAAQVDVVFTMLAHPDAVAETALGKDGFLSHLARAGCGLIAAPSTTHSLKKWRQRRKPMAFTFLMPRSPAPSPLRSRESSRSGWVVPRKIWK